MICSVRQDDGAYRYYQAPKAPVPGTKAPLGSVGLSIGEALPSLPAGATPTGGGRRARGVLCRQSIPGLGNFFDPVDRPFSSLVAVVGLVWGVWWLSRY